MAATNEPATNHSPARSSFPAGNPVLMGSALLTTLAVSVAAIAGAPAALIAMLALVGAGLVLGAMLTSRRQHAEGTQHSSSRNDTEIVDGPAQRVAELATLRAAEDIRAMAHQLETSLARLSLPNYAAPGSATPGAGQSHIPSDPLAAATVAAVMRDISDRVAATTELLHEVAKRLRGFYKENHDSTAAAASVRAGWGQLSSQLRLSSQRVESILQHGRRISAAAIATGTKLTEAHSSRSRLEAKIAAVDTHVSRLADLSVSNASRLRSARDAMEMCRNDVASASSLVENLSRRAREIVSTIDIIDDIAEQTNLLALNASIEAARAGEQGQGFAVVAEEVRKLAARSSTATRSINELLGTIQSESEQAAHQLSQGSKSVEAASESVTSFAPAFDEVLRNARNEQVQLEELTREISSLLATLGDALKENSEATSTTASMRRIIDDASRMQIQLAATFNNLGGEADTQSRSLERHDIELVHLENLVVASKSQLQDVATGARNGLEAAARLSGWTPAPATATHQGASQGAEMAHIQAAAQRYLSQIRESASTVVSTVEAQSHRVFRIRRNQTNTGTIGDVNVGSLSGGRAAASSSFGKEPVVEFALPDESSGQSSQDRNVSKVG